MSFLKIRRKGDSNSQPSDLGDDDIAIVAKDILGISDQAAKKVIEVLKNNAQENGYVRVAIRGGGCSGLSLHYEICEQVKENDLIFTHHSAKVCIDPKSLSILGGATLHIKEELGVSSFILVNNPVAKQCSCGQSFSL